MKSVGASCDTMAPITPENTQESVHDVTESDSVDGSELDSGNQASVHDRDPANGPTSASFVDGPYQPRLTTLQGGRPRSFQAAWYEQFPWQYSSKHSVFAADYMLQVCQGELNQLLYVMECGIGERLLERMANLLAMLNQMFTRIHG